MNINLSATVLQHDRKEVSPPHALLHISFLPYSISLSAFPCEHVCILHMFLSLLNKPNLNVFHGACTNPIRNNLIVVTKTGNKIQLKFYCIRIRIANGKWNLFCVNFQNRQEIKIFW